MPVLYRSPFYKGSGLSQPCDEHPAGASVSYVGASCKCLFVTGVTLIIDAPASASHAKASCKCLFCSSCLFHDCAGLDQPCKSILQVPVFYSRVTFINIPASVSHAAASCMCGFVAGVTFIIVLAMHGHMPFIYTWHRSTFNTQLVPAWVHALQPSQLIVHGIC